MDREVRKEIIIITEDNDKSSERVIDWLYFYRIGFNRINVDVDFAHFKIQIKQKSVSSSFINQSIWNRRGYLPIIPTELKKSSWINYLKKEQLPVLFAFDTIFFKKSIGSYSQELMNNKLLSLKYAADCGFEIPDTFVTNNKEDLFHFIETEKRYITKSLYRSPSLETSEYTFKGAGTSFLELDEIEDIFSPSLIQEYIEKEIEIRIFFIKDFFFSMAIFSQNDEQTKVDFRNYNHTKQNRNVPFNLPDFVLKKLKKFTKKTNHDTGSIDLILTTKGKYVFLEINPMGQYDWVSQNCNYHIDKTIAEILIKN